MKAAPPAIPRLVRLVSTSSTSTLSSGSPAFFPTNSFSQPSRSEPLPHNAQWFTARPSLNATLDRLNQTVTLSRTHLFRAGLLPAIDTPLNVDAEFSETLPHPRARRWKDAKEMSTYLRNGTDLRSSQYKKLTSVLSHLEGLLPYAELADALTSQEGPHPPSLVVDPVAASKGRDTPAALAEFKSDSPSLFSQLEEILLNFQQPPSISSSGLAVTRVVGKDRRLGKKDALGRVMAVGRRKESSARVWIVPSSSDVTDAAQQPGSILVNTLALPSYFAMSTHRGAVVRPLTLTSSLGAFNVFAIVKGGGIAAQADAVAMGLGRALAEWERCEIEAGRMEEGVETWRDILKKGKRSFAEEI